MANRLAAESSPYLRQHATNPVDWWPWGEAAFAAARAADKPVFVSIGYAACHWCHVMAHESFEDEATARVMNDKFINIKIDREERPDVDAVFMNAITVQGEGGGWPLSAFCLPDGRPFFLGTYFPPAPKFGRPSFGELLAAMSDAYRTRKADAVDNAEQLADGLQRLDAHYRRGASGDADPGQLGVQQIIAAGRHLVERCDAKRGGPSGAPKFPNSAMHAMLARASRMSHGKPAGEAFDAWARGMSDGGIYDHLGGGFARYAVDDKWLVPHFEKMLYDQAQLLGIYADVHARGGPLAARAGEIIIETVAFLNRELTDAAGGLWSSLDADSEGEEGKFYVWTPAQVREAIGPMGAMIIARAYGVTDSGNFEHGATVLSRVTLRESAAEEDQLSELRGKLLAARAARVRPGTDDKVLAAWNGLAISGLVAAWRATGYTPALDLALRVAGFLRDRMVSGDAIARVFHEGKTKPLDGTLDDYAFCAQGFLELAEATGDAAWWTLGAKLLGTVRSKFAAKADGPDAGGSPAGGSGAEGRRGSIDVFYLAPAGDALLVHRPESHQDGAIPSGAGVAVRALLRLGLVAGDADALALAERYLVQRLAASSGPDTATSMPTLLAALDLYLHAQVLVATPGPGREALLAAARSVYAPNLCIAGPWASASILDGKTAASSAYVCTGPVCSLPITDPAALIKQLR
jgi:hypothetical protein